LENLETNVRYSFEGIPNALDNGKLYPTQEFNGNVTFVFPQLVIPFAHYFKMRFYRLNPRSRLLTGITYTKRAEYTRSIIRSSLTYTWQKSVTRQYTFTPYDLNIVNTNKTQAFEDTLNVLASRGNLLINSFKDAIVSSFSGSYLYNDYSSSVNKRSKYYRFYFEAGGNSFNMVTALLARDTAGDNSTGLPTLFSLPYYTFIRGISDFRVYRPYRVYNTIAFRINAGFAIPYLQKDPALPYEKYFFAGGSNSIRAWRPRRLGPGSQADESRPGYDPERPGELILETSLEYRFPMVGILTGAVFVDAGNVWRISEEDSLRQNSNFALNRFYKEIAVGTGLGFRFDFT
jgi:outer membrane protein insertion porin family